MHKLAPVQFLNESGFSFSALAFSPEYSGPYAIAKPVSHPSIQFVEFVLNTCHSESIKILVLSEEDFDAPKDVNLESLRFGASEKVNFGGGCKVIRTEKFGKYLVVEFDGTGNGINKNNFVCKLLGKTKNGNLLIGYTKLMSD